VSITLTATTLRVVWSALLLVLAASAVSCRSDSQAAGQLHAREIALQRQVAGLRATVERLERGEPMMPADDVVIGIDDQLVSALIKAQLPISFDVEGHHLDLKDVEVEFNGSPVVRLRGRIAMAGQPGMATDVSVFGALDGLEIHGPSSTLRGKIVVDYLAIDGAQGIGQFLAGFIREEVAHQLRLQVTDRLPEIQIPVRVQQHVEFPAQIEGPAQITGATMPLAATLSLVTAARNQLWIAVHIVPGEVVKAADAPRDREAR
jgi:hypothetical protein